MDERRSGFWSTLPGILTGMAALITAVTGAYFAFNQAPSKPPQSPVDTSMAAPVEVRPTDVAAEPATPMTAEVPATVNDVDGWTNLRAEPAIKAPILVRINKGEIFYTTPQDGNWWPARTESGVKGYIHSSRVQLNP